MARGRMILRKTGKNDALQNLLEEFGPYAVILHHRLLAFQDRNGNVQADKNSLKADCFPLAGSIKPGACERFLRGMEKHELVKIYVVGRLTYANFPAFDRNQSGLNYNKEKDEHPLAPWQTAGNLPENPRKNSGNPPEKVCPQSELESESEREEKNPPTPLPETGDVKKPPTDHRADAERLVQNLVATKRARPESPQPKPGSLSAEVVDKALAICKTAGVKETDKARIFSLCKQIAVKHGPAVLDRINGNLRESLATGNITNPLGLALHALNESVYAPG